MNKKTNECHLVDVACPVDSWICLKELEKEEKYIGLAKVAESMVSANQYQGSWKCIGFDTF